ncbi:MAG: TRAP transporter large permease subunit, partial [Rhodospirillales bacterium]|nr:TRAP transporter large permease subunit [Rhodospirillales bacterium]
MLVVSVLLLLIVLLIAGLPLFFAMGAASAFYMFMSDIPIALMAQRMTASVNGFIILAIPFFYLAGELMNLCRLTDKIIA